MQRRPTQCSILGKPFIKIIRLQKDTWIQTACNFVYKYLTSFHPVCGMTSHVSPPPNMFLHNQCRQRNLGPLCYIHNHMVSDVCCKQLHINMNIKLKHHKGYIFKVCVYLLYIHTNTHARTQQLAVNLLHVYTMKGLQYLGELSGTA